MATFLRELKRLMFATYGERFEHRVAAAEACAAWEGVWRSVFEGKTPGRCRRAIEVCLKTYSAPFTPSHFAEQYAALPKDERPCQELPPPPISDREVAQEYLESLHGILHKRGILRTERNIASGEWTDEMERRFQRDLKITGFGKPRISAVPLANHVCAYPDCDNTGIFSASVTGSSTWYCARHSR